MSKRVAFCTTCEQTTEVQWSSDHWRYAGHTVESVIGVAVTGSNPLGVAVRDDPCRASGDPLPPGVFTTAAREAEDFAAVRQMEDLGNGRSISRSFSGCATCDDGGCGDCR